MAYLLKFIYTGNDADEIRQPIYNLSPPWKKNEIASECILHRGTEKFVWAGFLDFIERESFSTALKLAVMARQLPRAFNSTIATPILRVDFADIHNTPIPHHNAYQFGVTMNYYYEDKGERSFQITWVFLANVRNYIATSNLKKYLTHKNKAFRKVAKDLV